MADPLKGAVERRQPELAPQLEESPVLADEKTFEGLPKPEEPFLEEDAPKTEIQLPAIEQKKAPSRTATATVAPIKKDEAMVEVEKVLEAGLGDFYASLPPDAKEKFKQKGEEASTNIAQMVRGLKLNAKKALELIRNWLLTIPKVNKFFLEQEAKIKVDLIAALIEQRKEAALKQT